MIKRLKKITACIFLFVMLISAFMYSVSAALVGDSYGYYYQINDDNTATIEYYKGSNQYVKVPEYYNGHLIVNISSNAFGKNTNVVSVIIPDTVTSMDTFSFYNCSNLKNVVLSKSMNEIGMAFFRNCGKLETVIIPDSITSIAGNAFYGAGNATILCSEGSYAQQYAIEKGMNYVLLNGKLADVNFDDKIDIIDATLIQKSLIGITDLDVAQKYYADVNGDGVVSVDDATEIQKYLVGVESALD